MYEFKEKQRLIREMIPPASYFINDLSIQVRDISLESGPPNTFLPMLTFVCTREWSNPNEYSCM